MAGTTCFWYIYRMQNINLSGRRLVLHCWGCRHGCLIQRETDNKLQRETFVLPTGSRLFASTCLSPPFSIFLCSCLHSLIKMEFAHYHRLSALLSMSQQPGSSFYILLPYAAGKARCLRLCYYSQQLFNICGSPNSNNFTLDCLF